LEGQEFRALDGGPIFKFNESISLYVDCVDQEEVDYLWEKLSTVPESEQCGWCKDKFGVSWQIIPRKLGELMSDPDKEKSGRVISAMLQMKKIDVAGLQKAYDGQ
jgi:predicted 3-demethylubiquinone-9 3-methyltransferase (glyoxalase superfamily)